MKSVRPYILALILALIPSLVFGQGGNLGSNSSPTLNRNGQAMSGVKIAICQPVATTAAAVVSNLATFTMASNPVTAGFVTGMKIMVSGFSGGDTYFNAGTLTSGVITSGYTILTVTPTTIVVALTHANSAAGTNGTILQQGNTTTSCAGVSTIYSNSTLVTTTTQPVVTDSQGNWNVFAQPGVYYVQFYGTSVTTTIKIIALSCAPNSGATAGCTVLTNQLNNFTVLQEFSAGISADGTHIEAIPSTTSTLMDLATPQTVTALKTFNGGIAGLGHGGFTFNIDIVAAANVVYAQVTNGGSGGSITTTTRGGQVNLLAVVPVAAAVQPCIFTFSQDGVDGNQLLSVPAGLTETNYTIHSFYTPVAGSHTYALRVKATAGGTCSLHFGGLSNGTFTAQELSQ